MSDRPPLRRANFTLHIATVAGLSHHPESLLTRLEYVRLLDEVLDLFETEPAFQHFVLDGEVAPLEDYLTIRPENFERIEQLVDEGKLIIGPWYSQYDPSLSTPETAIRSLMLGLRTADIFGRPMMVGYVPQISDLPGYLPQVLKSFGIDVAISDQVKGDSPNEILWIGDDGTEILLGQMRQSVVAIDTTIVDMRVESASYAESGQVLIPFVWDMKKDHTERLKLLASIPVARTALYDTVFHSHPSAYSKAVNQWMRKNSLSKIYSKPYFPNCASPAEMVLTRVVEPLLAWANLLELADFQAAIHRPQYLLQMLWKQYLSGRNTSELVEECYQLAGSILEGIAQQVNTQQPGVTDQTTIVFNPGFTHEWFASTPISPLGFITLVIDELSEGDKELLEEGEIIKVETGIHGGILSPSTSLVVASNAQFFITAAKLPEDPEHEGLIVRGHNTSDEDIWVALTPWRPYKIIDVVTMGEEPTGGRLAQESNGAVRFKAAPHHILTFWFHDD